MRHQPNDVLLLGVVIGLFDGCVVDEDWGARGLRLLKVVRILEEAKDLPAKDCVVSFPRSQSGAFASGLGREKFFIQFHVTLTNSIISTDFVGKKIT